MLPQLAFQSILSSSGVRDAAAAGLPIDVVFDRENIQNIASDIVYIWILVDATVVGVAIASGGFRHATT